MIGFMNIHGAKQTMSDRKVQREEDEHTWHLKNLYSFFIWPLKCNAKGGSRVFFHDNM